MSGLEMKYFVLNPAGIDDHAVACRNAMLEYANSIQRANPRLALDLQDWVQRETEAAHNLRWRYDDGL